MNISRMFVAFGIALSVLILSQNTFAQSTASNVSRAKQDQVIDELLSEVHKLRVAMQQMSVNAFRGQIMVERLRLQQDQVNRLAKDQAETRNEIAEIRSQQANMKERLNEATKQQDAGLISEQQLNDFRAMTSELKRREQTLLERESQVSQELERERLNLVDLNQRLDAIERDMVRSANVDLENPKR